MAESKQSFRTANLPIPQSRQPAIPVMIELADISTPCEQAVVARVGAIVPGVVTVATDAQFHVVPIVNEDGTCAGTIRVEALAKLAAEGTPLTADHATDTNDLLPHLISVTSLVKTLAEREVVIHAADPEDEDFPPDWFGLISVADLNRPIFRAHVYQMLVILETSLGQLIMDDFSDDWGAIRLLSEHNQARVKEFYDEERAEGVDLSPITTVTLSDLFHIATESKRVWKLMGFDNAESLGPVAHQINGLRNTIMHPVRPLIVNKNDLNDLASGLVAVEKLSETITKRIGASTG